MSSEFHSPICVFFKRNCVQGTPRAIMIDQQNPTGDHQGMESVNYSHKLQVV